MKNKRGFTLVEIMITVGIIVIVAAAGTIGVVISLRRSKEKAANLSAGAQNFESEAIENLGQLNANNDYVPPVQTKLPEDTATPTPGPGTVTPTAGPTAGPSSAPTSAPTVTQAPTSAPTSAPTTAPASGGSATYNGPLGHRGDAGNTIQSISDNPDGSTTINLCYNQWNDGAVTIRSNGDGTYQIHGDRNGGNVIGNALASTGVSFDWGPINNNQTFTMNNEQATAWANVYGITLN